MNTEEYERMRVQVEANNAKIESVGYALSILNGEYSELRRFNRTLNIAFNSIPIEEVENDNSKK
jgi:hypothetical protein